MRRFAITLRLELSAVENAIQEPWSNGQTEGQVNRLKTAFCMGRRPARTDL